MEMNRAKSVTPSLLERALQLARSGEFEFLYQIERKLKAEGYSRVETTLSDDPELRKLVRDAIGQRRSPKPASVGRR